MKKSVTFKTILRAAILLMVLIPFLFISSCQKEEPLITDSDSISVNQLKSGTISADDIDDLITKIENYVTSGDLEPGIANSFLVKLINAKKSLENGIENAAVNQLIALKNQLEDLIFEETINTSIGEELMLDLNVTLGVGEWTCGMPFRDERDGKVYQTVKIGEQCWMAENLAYLPSVNPLSDGSFIDPHYYVYGYDGTILTEAKETDNYSTYGVLYNWPAAMEACPDGWHLPSDAEWTQLQDYLIAYGYNYEETTTENKIAKSLASTTLWNTSSNTGVIGDDLSANNSSGFSALPGGYRYTGGLFYGIGIYGYWWSATENDINFAWGWYLYYNSTEVGQYSRFKDFGFSVRCVRD
jgi:uncharacterized protein (TIGR02145 family)